MSSLLQTEIIESSLDNIRGIIAQPERIESYWQHERNLRLSYSLQSHLDINKILHTFQDAIKTEIPFDGFIYRNETLDQNIIIGGKAIHGITYALRIEEESLGSIQLLRQKRFSEEECIELEEMLCMLIYPLRNGIHYHRVLKNSLHDCVTGIANRNGLQDSLRHEWELANRYKHPLALLIIDIDHFKNINDNFGHLCGDQVLAQIASIINSCVRECDLVYRYGGDEFTVILRETDQVGAIALAERIRSTINHTRYQYKNSQVNLSVSIGISCNHKQKNGNAIELLEDADQALYRAKRDGRNQVSL